MTPKIGGKKKFLEKKFPKKKIFLHCLSLRLSGMHDDPPNVCLSKVIHCSQVSWPECGSCEGFMLCMSSFIYLFVVFPCRPVDDVAFVYL